MFEYTPASSESARSTFLERVRSSDLFIWLVGADTSAAVEDEIKAALDHQIPLLIFKLPVSERTDRTEELLAQLGQHAKWVDVDDVAHLGQVVRLTLEDEIVRAVRKRTAGLGRLPYIESVGRLSRSRCIARWQGGGIPSASAIEFADDPGMGAPAPDVAKKRGLVLLIGPIGSGKSLTAERLLQGAIAHAFENDAAPLPVYLEAAQIQGGVAEAIAKVVSPVGGSVGGVSVVIDGFESLGSQLAVKLLDEVRAYCHADPETTIWVTSRPIPTLARVEECLHLSPLSVEESLALINLAGVSRLSTYSVSDWPVSLRDAVQWPLFAILAGSFIRAYGRPPSNVVSLIDDVINEAIARAGIERDALEPVPALAADSVEHGLGPIHAGEVHLTTDMRFSLVRAGLIVDSGDSVQFSLPLFAQWFAAQWLLDGNQPAMSDLRGAEAWSTSLSIAVGKGGFDRAFNPMDMLVRRFPGVAGEVIDDALSRWGDESDVSRVQLSNKELGRVPTTMVSWIEGLGDLGRLIGPLTKRGLSPFVAQTYGSSLSTSWYFGDDEIASEPPPEAFRGQWPWGLVLSGPVGSGANWPWRWSLETLKLSLENTMSTRSLPSDGTFIEREAAWKTALEIVGRGSLSSEPIDLELLGEEAVQRIEAERRTFVRPRRLRVSEMKRIIEQLQARGVQAMEPPLPGPDRNLAGGWVWSPYSEERLIERTTAVYESALQAFTEIVERWFANLRHVMPRALMMPVVMRGQLGIANDRAGMGPVLEYHWEPIDKLETSVVDVTAEGPSVAGADIFERVMVAIRRHRSAVAHRLSPSGATTVLEIFGSDPVTRLVYRWIWDDLSSAGWLSGSAPYEEADNIVGAKLAGMRLVKIDDDEK